MDEGHFVMSTSRIWTGDKLFCFGFGYCAAELARQLAGHCWSIVGTRRGDQGGAAAIGDAGGIALTQFAGNSAGAQVGTALTGATHVLVSIPPGADGDPVLLWHADDLAGCADVKWIGYLSTIGVYGDTGGGWVDETSPINPGSERGRRRAQAEAEWQAFGQRTGKRVEIFRLPGIYGPGRSAIDTVKAGTARRVVKPGQVFNRIHVADIGATLARAMALAAEGRSPEHTVYNVTDDEPAPPQDVVAFAAELLGYPVPPDQPFETAAMSAMGRSFYGESKRVRNCRLKAALEITLRFPTYREGLRALAAQACG